MSKELGVCSLSWLKKGIREAGKYTKIVQESNGIKIQMAESCRGSPGYNFNPRNKVLLFQ